jgi:hypothetical protein
MLDAFGWVFSVIMLAGGLWSLFGVSVAFAAMDVYGVFKWRK